MYIRSLVEKMQSVVNLSNKLCVVLSHMRCTGIRIDQKALEEVENEYRTELARLDHDLREIVFRVMGTEHYNLNSLDDLSAIIYSIKITDKARWKDVFGLGTDERGKKKRPNKLSKQDFDNTVRKYAKVLRRVGSVDNCSLCEGTGFITRVKKDGTQYKRKTKCPSCGGMGYTYSYEDRIAGLKVPIKQSLVSTNGFVTNKEVLAAIALDTKCETTREFVTKLLRYNAVSVYLASFVEGIKKGICDDGVLRPDFMQSVTKTGRLSSRNPNFQNQPRGATFPIRRCVVSRFEGGKILEVDHAQLEFRCAVELSGDTQGVVDIKNGVDKHQFTADIIGCSRQEAKAHTFKPLYGGFTGSDKEMEYYQAFLDHHQGIAAWHERIKEEAVANKTVTIPTGRTFHFPYAVRKAWGVTESTKIVNYPVQGIATADIVPLALVKCFEELKKLKLDKGAKSVIINTVHDSIVFDVYPGEEQMILELVVDVYSNLHKHILNFFGYKFKIPLDFEIKMGYNWMHMDEVYKSNLEFNP